MRKNVLFSYGYVFIAVIIALAFFVIKSPLNGEEGEDHSSDREEVEKAPSPDDKEAAADTEEQSEIVQNEIKEAITEIADAGSQQGKAEDAEESSPAPEKKYHKVYVITVEGVISKPIEYILRRGIKEAIDNEVDSVVLDMNTPGGRVDVTLEMMDTLDRFEGDTITYVNVDATSAGAFIAASTHEIYFAPKGQIGAAAPIMPGGQEIPETAKLKIMSHLRAKIRTYTEKYPFRAEVIRAMMDENFVLEIDGKVIKGEGELLTLTASEAMDEYGDPPRALLGAGIAASLEELLNDKYGESNYEIKAFEITWSESLAQYLDMIKPVLMGLGILCLIIEFKTPNFGIVGGIGIGMLLVVFISNYVVGLAGQEAVILFLLGLVLIAVELFVLPGTIFPAVTGLALVFGSLIWSLADIWPGDAFELNPDILWPPVYELALSVTIAILGVLLLWRFLPKSWVWDKLTLSGGVAAPDPLTAGGGSSYDKGVELPEIGAQGVAVSDLHPAGEIEIEGRRYEATLGYGILDRGEAVEVTGHQSFALIVKKTSV